MSNLSPNFEDPVPSMRLHLRHLSCSHHHTRNYSAAGTSTHRKPSNLQLPSNRPQVCRLAPPHYLKRSVTNAIGRPDAKQWMRSLKDELPSLGDKKPCILCDLPLNRRCIGTKWVFKVKRGLRTATTTSSSVSVDKSLRDTMPLSGRIFDKGRSKNDASDIRSTWKPFGIQNLP